MSCEKIYFKIAKKIYNKLIKILVEIKRLNMIWVLVFHSFVLISTGYGLFYEFKYIKFPETDFKWHHSFGGKFKFLSVQNMLIQFIYFLIAIVNDLNNDSNCTHQHLCIQTLKDNYFSGLAFPLAIFVTINFWVLFFTKRDTIFPQPFHDIVPKWHLHVLHTNVTVFMIMEMNICFRKYPEFCTGLITILTYMMTYILWLHTIRYFAGFWVYPLLNDKNFKNLYTYFGSVLLQCIIIYMLGEILNNAVWSGHLN